MKSNMKMFALGRFALFLSWAKTGTWEITKEDSQRTLYFSILTVTRQGQNMHGLIIGPLAVYVAYVSDD